MLIRTWRGKIIKPVLHYGKRRWKTAANDLSFTQSVFRFDEHRLLADYARTDFHSCLDIGWVGGNNSCLNDESDMDRRYGGRV